MNTTHTRQAMTVSRGLILGRCLYRLWHFLLGLLAFGLVGIVVAGHVGQALILVIACYLAEKILQRLLRRSVW